MSYLVNAQRRIYVSMDSAAAEAAGVSQESKHHPHVIIGPLSFGGAQAVQEESTNTGQTVALLVHGIVAVGGDWSLYPLPVAGKWPALTTKDDYDIRRKTINGLTMADIQRIGQHLSQDLTLGEEEGN